MKKTKKFTKEFQLRGKESTSDYVGFTLRITESRVEIETKAKDWKVSFGRQTYEYGYIAYMIKEGNVDNLHSVAVAIFLTRWIFRDAEMVLDMIALSEKVSERVQKRAAKPEDSDEIILAEEKAMHEKDISSVIELETLKSDKENAEPINN